MSEILTGGCACGQLRYTWTPGVKFRIYACHCKDCQTRSGSAFALQMGTLANDLNVLGSTIEGKIVQPSGAVATQFACPDCLTRVYASNDQRPGYLTVRAGTLDDSSSITPAFHLWVKSKQPWVVIPDDVPALETQPTNQAEWMPLLLGTT
jgi:hypothetical protein